MVILFTFIWYVYVNYLERVGSDLFEHSWVGLSQQFSGLGRVQKSGPWTGQNPRKVIDWGDWDVLRKYIDWDI